MAFRINWKKFNWCSECGLKQRKSKGFWCPDCKRQMRTKPRRKTLTNNEILVIRY